MGIVNDKQIKAGEPGRYLVGDGLYLRISGEGSPFWVFRYVIHKRRREKTLGRYPDMTLAEARAEAAITKRNIKDGVDPLAEKHRVGNR